MFIIKGLIISLMMIVPVLCFLTLYNLIVNSLLTGDDDVKLFFACLEPLWHWLDPSIPVQHVQDPILCVSCVIQGFNTGYFEMSKDTFVFYIIHVVYDDLLVNFFMSFHINSDQYVVICIRSLKRLLLTLIRSWYILVKCSTQGYSSGSFLIKSLYISS